MRRFVLFARLLFCAALANVLLSSASRGALDPVDAARILPVSQVHAGMRGYGLTVFRGDKVERFDVKVEGVLPNINSGRPLILVRVGGGELSKRAINIAEGMSGSPIYINGKIIGAIAYAGSFAVEPLGLVTPIEDMLTAWNPHLPSTPPGTGQIKPLPRPVSVGGKAMTSVGILPSLESKPSSSDPTCAWFRPVGTPLITSGLSARTLAMATDKLSMLPVSIRSGPGRMPGKQSALKEGAAVGFSLTTGDVEMTAIGTVTYARGGRVLAFGHPFLGMGPIELPMSTVWVHDIFPSYEASYKLASPMTVIGSSSQDMPFSVAGAVGKRADMVPVDINVHGDIGGPAHHFHVDVIKHPLLTPVLTTLVTSEALARERPYPGEAMARVSVSVSGKDIGTIKRSNLFFSPVDITTSAMGDLEDMLTLLQSNKFHPVLLTKLTMDVDIIQTRQTADIERIVMDKAVYQPGEMIDAAVQLRPYSADPVIRHIQVKVPDNAMDGRGLLIVQGGGAVIGTPTVPAAPGAPVIARSPSPSLEILEATSVKQMLERYAKTNTNDQLVAKLQLPTASFSVEGEKLVNFPPAMENAIQTPRATPSRLIRDEVKVAANTQWYVNGAQALPVTIRRKSHAETASPAQPAASAPAAESTTDSTEEEQPSKPTVLGEDEEIAVSSALQKRDSIELFRYDGDSETSEDSSSDDASASDASSSEDLDAKAADGSDASSSATDNKDSAEAKSKPKLEVKDIGRATKTWLQTTEADFLKGDPSGVAVSSTGAVVPGFAFTKTGAVTDPYIWAVCPKDDGETLVATGSKGRVWKIKGSGDAEELFAVSGSQATSLVVDSAGRVWAGSSPDGTVWAFEQGKARKVAALETKHVAALAPAGENAVYAAAGDSGKIWRVSADGKVSLFADTHQRNTQTLEAAGGVLYAGTSGVAAVWRISGGQPEALLRVNEDYISNIGLAEDGTIYASSGPRGKVYRIAPGKAGLPVIDRLKASSAPLVVSKDGTAVVVDDGMVYRLLPDKTWITQKADDLHDVFALAKTSSGDILAGTANGGALWRISPASTGRFVSAVHDAERPARWGIVQSVSTGGKAALEVRSGNTPEPDQTWSAWKAVLGGESVDIDGERYLQYRAEISGDAPRLEQLQFKYLPANRPPTVKLTKPASGSALSGSQTVSWSGSDPDGDKLTYKLYYSSDEGKTWKVLDGAVAKASSSSKPEEKKSEASSKGSADKPSSEDAAVDRKTLEEMLKNHPEIPAELRKQILESAPEMRKKIGDELKAEKAEKGAGAADDADKSTTSTSYTWDTSKFDDGQYLLKIEASDALANGPDALSGTAQTGPVRVANAKPTVKLYGWVEKSGADGMVVRGVASSKSAAIATVQYRIDGKGDWAVALPADGLFDGPDEDFRVPLKGIRAGQHKVEAQVKDSAGNTARTDRQIMVKGKATPGKE